MDTTVAAAEPGPDTPTGQTAPTAPTRPDGPREVTISVGIDGPDVDAELVGDVSVGGDPFGDFAVCSAHATQAVTYRVAVGSSTSSVRWAALSTVDPVLGAGSYDADVRVEYSSGASLEAIGEVTLDEGLLGGSFTASTVDGVEVRGVFDCPGGSPTMTGAFGTRPGLVEIVALLERDGAERVVSLVSDDPAVVDCPLGAGGSDVLVEARGGPQHGAITGFVLAGRSGEGAVRLRAGDVLFEAAVELTAAAAGTAGAFSSTGAAEVSIDGAFSCTES